MMGGTRKPDAVTADDLRKLLHAAELTQQSAADLIGVSLRTMQRYLSDAHAKDIRKSALVLLQDAAEMHVRTKPPLIERAPPSENWDH